MKKKMFPLIRDLTVSFTIGCLSTYLPFWRMDGKYDQGMIGFAVGVLVFYFMVATNRDYQQ